MKKLLLVLIFVLTAGLSNVYADEPLTVLKGEIDKVFNILNDETYKDESNKEEQHNRLWNIIKGIFDFKIMSRYTLARNWRDFTPEEQQEFAEVFGRFLGNNYLNKIQSGFSGQEVEYLGDEMVSDGKAVVKTNIIKNNVKTPVNYNMRLNNNTWKIYDVKIEGVSLLKNYRSQFGSILLKDKPGQLIESIKAKI